MERDKKSYSFPGTTQRSSALQQCMQQQHDSVLWALVYNLGAASPFVVIRQPSETGTWFRRIKRKEYLHDDSLYSVIRLICNKSPLSPIVTVVAALDVSEN